MKILIKPSDIIKRCLWYKYEFYILDGKNKSEIDEIIEKDEEFQIPERSALVIGLIKDIETPNISHKLNQHIFHILSSRSSEQTLRDGRTVYMIRKNLLEDEINQFEKNFPSKWNKSIVYQKEYDKYLTYNKKLLEDISKLDTLKVEFQGRTSIYVQISQVKKLLNQNF